MGNLALRTDPRWDNMVRHLGYEPVDAPQPQGTPLDTELVDESQRRLQAAKIVPDESLTPQQRASLSLIRHAVSFLQGSHHHPTIYAADIPPASDRVRTAGLYARTTGAIYISREQLERGQTAMDTMIHELAHHTSHAEDLEDHHIGEISRIAGEVIPATSRGAFDSIVKDPNLCW